MRKKNMKESKKMTLEDVATESAKLVAKAFKLTASKDESDKRKGVEKMRRAVALGCDEAKYFLAEMYSEGFCVKRSDKKAFPLYLQAARDGLSDAQAKVALFYKNGRGVKKNEKKAYKWIMRAAKNGNVEAQCIVGMSYMYGDGLCQNHKNAIYWLGFAASKGDAIALCALWDYNKAAFPEDMYEFETEADKSCASEKSEEERLCHEQFVKSIRLTDEERDELGEADWKAGMAYSDGKDIEKNIDAAVYFFMLSALLDNPKGCYAVANCIYSGVGMERSDDDAFFWMERAASSGYPDAEYAISIFYEEGIGTESSDDESFRWLQKAAEDGQPYAMYRLGVRYEDRIVPEDEIESANSCFERAASCFEAAADCGVTEAMHRMGIFYKYGLGVEPNERSAAKLFEDAALRGYIPAMYELAACYECGIGVDASKAQAEKWRDAAKDAESRL